MRSPAQERNIYFMAELNGVTFRFFVSADMLHKALHLDVEDNEALWAFTNTISPPTARAVLHTIMNSRAASMELKDWLKRSDAPATVITGGTGGTHIAVADTQQAAYDVFRGRTTPTHEDVSTPMSDMKKMLAIMAQPNSLGDPLLIKENYDGETHGDVNVCGGRECELIGMVGDNYRVRYVDDGSVGTVDPANCDGANSRLSEVDESAVRESADEEGDVADDFEELFEEMQDIIGRLENIARRLPRFERERARAYWLAHIKSAVASEEYGYGGYETDMAGTLEALRKGGDPD